MPSYVREDKGNAPSSKSKWETLQILLNLPLLVYPSSRIEMFRIGEVLRIPTDCPNVANDGSAFRDAIVFLRAHETQL